MLEAKACVCEVSRCGIGGPTSGCEVRGTVDLSVLIKSSRDILTVWFNIGITLGVVAVVCLSDVFRTRGCRFDCRSGWRIQRILTWKSEV